jgi:hypothetical protein
MLEAPPAAAGCPLTGPAVPKADSPRMGQWATWAPEPLRAIAGHCGPLRARGEGRGTRTPGRRKSTNGGRRGSDCRACDAMCRKSCNEISGPGTAVGFATPGVANATTALPRRGVCSICDTRLDLPTAIMPSRPQLPGIHPPKISSGPSQGSTTGRGLAPSPPRPLAPSPEAYPPTSGITVDPRGPRRRTGRTLNDTGRTAGTPTSSCILGR